MAKKPTPQAPQQAPQTERYDVYVVENFSSQGEDRSSWTRVGVAFPHDDGKVGKGPANDCSRWRRTVTADPLLTSAAPDRAPKSCPSQRRTVDRSSGQRASYRTAGSRHFDPHHRPFGVNSSLLRGRASTGLPSRARSLIS